MIIDDRVDYVSGGIKDSKFNKCKDCVNTFYDVNDHIYCNRLYYLIDGDDTKYWGGISIWGRCNLFENKNVTGNSIQHIFSQDVDW